MHYKTQRGSESVAVLIQMKNWCFWGKILGKIYFWKTKCNSLIEMWNHKGGLAVLIIPNNLPVMPSLLPSNQNSSTTLSTSMTSPVKSGSSSETLGRNSKTARTTDPASITHNLSGQATDQEIILTLWRIKCMKSWRRVKQVRRLKTRFRRTRVLFKILSLQINKSLTESFCETTANERGIEDVRNLQ